MLAEMLAAGSGGGSFQTSEGINISGSTLTNGKIECGFRPKSIFLHCCVNNGAIIECVYDADNPPQTGDYLRDLYYNGTWTVDYPTIVDNPSVTGIGGIDNTGFTISYSPNVSSNVSRIAYLAAG